MKRFYRTFETDWGWCGVVGTCRGLYAFLLPVFSPEEAESNLIRFIHRGDERVQSGFDDVVDSVCRYFRGERIDFNFPLDMSFGTPFMQRVWEATRLIPYGETRSYAWVARMAGSPRAFRAVGMALARNPLPLFVPCHRVIGSDGSLKGFSAPGGVKLKMKLLEHEGIRRPKPTV
ncbi:TPA: methylated-DNA--[protein]-cysteine S-methyltransferase [Candidatus Poribacteria bacterium]|nr:methylated-DNA--[protein]-cysteine S-methyltransferase [Candidatus Poribacteria bacterium]HEX30468.1 methylated-DNA--[protein]-cysteine S-methyltransferase [Candidatus Poribacteria bacterium]